MRRLGIKTALRGQQMHEFNQKTGSEETLSSNSILSQITEKRKSGK